MIAPRHAWIGPTLLAWPLAFAGLPVRAQEPAASEVAVAGDVVELTNGGMVRGTIVEILPGDSLAIVSAANGETRRFEWARVAAYVRDGVRNTATPAPVYVPPPEPHGPHLHVELSRPAPVQLFEITGETFARGMGASVSTLRYRSVCVAPCDQKVGGGPDSEYFFGGEGVTDSRRFTLGGRGDELIAQVKPGRRSLRRGGLAAMGVGGVALVTGVVLAADANLTRVYVEVEGSTRGEWRQASFAPAIAVLSMGAGLLVGGVVMYLVGRTRVAWSKRGARPRP